MLKNSNGTFRPKRVNFSQVSNTALQDDNLSLKAKGLYSLIQSMITLPGDDGLKIWKISDKCKEGDTAFESAWKELKKCGYLKQYRIPDGSNKGQFRYEYELLDNPDLFTPAMANLTVKGEISTADKQDATPASPDETSEKANDEKQSQHQPKAESDHTPENQGNGADHTPGFPPYGQSTPCSKQSVEKGGDNSNTPSSNTLSSNTKSGNNQSISLSDDDTDRQTDEIRKDVLSRIDLDWIADNHPCDLDAAKTLIDCIVEMLVNPFTKINKTDQSRYALNKRLENVSENEIIGFLEHMRGTKVKYIKNINAYWKSAFINYLREVDLTASTF